MNYNDMKFYTAEEVAVKLRVPQGILMELIENSTLQAVNVGDTGIWIVEEKYILELLAEGNNRNESNRKMDLVEEHKGGNKIEAYEEKSELQCVEGEGVSVTEVKCGEGEGSLDRVDNYGVDSLDVEEIKAQENVCITSEGEAGINIFNIINVDKDKKDLLKACMSALNLSEGLEIVINEGNEEVIISDEDSSNGIKKEFALDDVSLEDDKKVEDTSFNELDEAGTLHMEQVENKPIVISKSDVVKHKDGDYVANNKFFYEENVIAEFIFDAEQAKKPVTDEIVLSKLGFDDNVHVCDDQEANERLLRLSNGGRNKNLFEEKKKVKGGKGKKSLNFNNESGRKVRKNFVIDEELIEKLQDFKESMGGSMSNIVEEALFMFFKSKTELGQVL